MSSPALEIQVALSKIRPHTSSTLAHQKKPAQLLVALESTIQSTSRNSGNSSSSSATPAASAYFAALVTTLQGTLTRNETSLDDGDVLPATLYLISIVIPFVPRTLLRSQSSTLLPILAPLLPHTNPHAPSLRSLVTILGIFISSLDSHSLDAPAPALCNVFSTLVEHTIDPRPKVRRKAAEAVRDILSNPPPPLQAHPWRIRVGEWACAVLQTQRAKPDTLIHLLASLKMLVPRLIAPEHVKTFTTHLLVLPKLSHPYLSQAAYGLLTSLLSSESDNIDPDEARETASSVLEAIAASPPSKQDAQLAPHWLSALGQASLAAPSPTTPSPSGMDLDTHSPSTVAQIDLPKIWDLAFTYLESTPEIRKSAEDTLIQLTQCAVPLLPHPPTSLLHTLEASMTSLAYAPALGNVLRILEGLVLVFAATWNDAANKSAAQAYFRDVVSKVGEMRVKKGFQYREGADAVFSAFARAAGVDALLSLLPLNLVPEER
jgi:ribosomal RNA-processing protein 12